MTPEIRFPREDIIRAGFEIIEEKGLEGLTALNIAKALDSSVKPIYSHFENMDNLKGEIFKKIIEQMKEYLYKDYGEDLAILNIAIGQILFAWDHMKLYLALYLYKDEKHQKILQDFGQESMERIMKDKALDGIPPGPIVGMYLQMSTYMHGFILQLGMDWYPPDFFNRQEIVRAVTQAGNCLYQGTIVHKIKGNLLKKEG
ncbi:TetR/AcrR family transcriptional regulator [bacterium]|nr:TetR/AcrR family transcriptional regulator [bacterium]